MKTLFRQFLAAVILLQSSMAFAQMPSLIQKNHKLERIHQLKLKSEEILAQVAVLEEKLNSQSMSLQERDWIKEDISKLMIEAAGYQAAYIFGLEVNGQHERVTEMVNEAKRELAEMERTGDIKSAVNFLSKGAFFLGLAALACTSFVELAPVVVVGTASAAMLFGAAGVWMTRDIDSVMSKINIKRIAVIKVAEIYFTQDQEEEALIQLGEIVAP
jgi:hypothetical protein